MKVNDVINEAFCDFKEKPEAGDFGCQYGASRTILKSAERECVAWFIKPSFGAAFVFKNGKNGYNAYHFCRIDFVNQMRGSMNELEPVWAAKFIQDNGGTMVVGVAEVEKDTYGECVGEIWTDEDESEWSPSNKIVVYCKAKGTKKGDFVGVASGVQGGYPVKVGAADIVNYIDVRKWESNISQEQMGLIRARVLGRKL